MAESLQIYSTVILVDIYLTNTYRLATRDFYDENDNYYKGGLDFPSISKELSDLYYGVEQGGTVTLHFPNIDNGIDSTWDTIIAGEEIRECWVKIQRHDPIGTSDLLAEDEDEILTEDSETIPVYESEQELEFRGKIIDYKLGDTVEITIEMRDDWILDTLLPTHTVTTDIFTDTALDLGAPINICFGKSRDVPLRNIQNNLGSDYYDYLVGYGTIQGLWVDHANGYGVKRDGVLVTASEYTFYDGSQTSPHGGFAFLRFTTEQMDFSGSFHSLTADVYGLEIDSASMERNFAVEIRTLLAWGLGDDVNNTSFATAKADLDSIGNMYGDGAITEQRAVRDILNELLFPARASIERNADGEWIIDIDVASASVLSLGDNDGYYNNAGIGDISITPSNEFLKRATVQYCFSSLSKDNPYKEMSISVQTFGVDRTYTLPFVLEDDTAERVLSYLKNRSLYSDRRIPVSAGMEARDLQRGDVITLTKPSRLLSAANFLVERITKGGIGFALECREYNANIHNNETITPLTAPVDSSITVSGPRSFVGDSQLGDGVNESGTITLHLAPGQGDCYIKGGTVDVAAWTCTGGFILGMDDSDGDKTKFFIGDSGGHSLSWNGSVLAVTGTLTATTGNIGGFYIGANDLWGGNAVIGNAATTIVIGNLDGTSKIALGVSADTIVLSTEFLGSCNFDSGGVTAPVVGDTFTGNTSGANARITSITVSGGTWAGGDAVGTIELDICEGRFHDNETVTTTTGGADTLTINMPDSAAGVDLVQNGDFSIDTDPPPGWTASNATLTTEAGGGIGNCMKVLDDGAGTGYAYQSITTVVGRLYTFQGGARDIDTGNNGQIKIGTAADNADYYDSGVITADAGAAYTVIFEATTTTTVITLKCTTAAGAYYFDEISLYGGAQSGFIVDGGGNLRVGDANSWLKWSGGALNIKLADGEALTLAAGGDIVMTPSDANPALIKWSTVHNFGAASTAARGLCLWPTTANQDYFQIGWDPVNNVVKRYAHFVVKVQTTASLGSLYDATHIAGVSSNAFAGSANVLMYAESGGLYFSCYLDAVTGSFRPSVTARTDVGTNTYKWKEGYFAGTVNANIFAAADYITALGGIHVGGLADPGTDNLLVDGRTSSGTATITASADDTDVSGINTLFINPAAAVVIGAFVGGVNGQELRVVIIDDDQNVTLEHNEGTGNQNIFLHRGVDETLDSHYGGWNLVCNGSNWYDESHSRHV